MVQFADIPQSGTFFKPAEYADAAAILIEPTLFKRQIPTNYGPKDEATATISVFNSQSDLDNGTPQVLNGTKIQQTLLARDLEQLVGKATIVNLAKRPATKPGQQDAWVWRTLQGEARDKTVAYVKAREAEVEAALGGADVPDYLKG